MHLITKRSGLDVDEPAWVPTVLTKNRERRWRAESVDSWLPF
jgi:hypothetical protein